MMKQPTRHKALTILVLLMVIFGMAATLAGIFSSGGAGPFEFESIHGKLVPIYGKGLYRHMSAEVAPQGIAQDYISLLIGIPLLVGSFFKSRSGSMPAHFVLAGTIGYFLVTYLFYTVMGMYNSLFLVWVMLMGASFYAFVIVMFSFDSIGLQHTFYPATPVNSAGAFLMVTAIAIAFMWLSIVVPPLLNGSIVPVQVEHYTTLIVQGLDLGILLPACFISGVLLLSRKPIGFLLAPVYLVFLSLLMTALTAKLVAMKILGYDVVPAIFIIPCFTLFAIFFTIGMLKNIRKTEQKTTPIKQLRRSRRYSGNI